MNPFSALDFSLEQLQNHVIAILSKSFKNRKNKSKEETTDYLLCQLFSCFSFDFKGFRKKYLRSKISGARFMSYVLYGVYYNEIPLAHLADPKNREWLECYLIALLAECTPQRSMRSMLANLSSKAQLKQMCYCFTYPREGAWMIIRLIQSIHFHNKEWNNLIHHLRTKFYDVNYLTRLLQEESRIKSLTQEMEIHAHKQIQAILELLPNKPYDFNQLISFFRIFGLSGYYLFPNVSHTLYEILSINTIAPTESAHIFISQFYHQLEIFLHHPEVYIEGLNRLVYALPTRGSHLQLQPWLPSILEGYKFMVHYLKDKTPNHPIMIFDQASHEQFQKNELFIQKLVREYGARVWHISQQQALKLAKKVDVEEWIKPFGYGGSRNCALLLAPLLFEAASQGKKSIQDVLQMDLSLLKTLFKAATLGNPRDIVIHMGEDDIEVPSSHYFINASFAYQHQHQYFCRPVYCIGRATHDVDPFITLEKLLNNPASAYFSTRWNPFPFSGLMKGMLTKPRFCLPLPFGNEELHVIPPYYIVDYFHQPLIHMGGTRFPHKLFPTSPLDGILEYLHNYVPYSIQICMSACLMDSQNALHRSIFPWNDKEHRFSSLGNLLEFARLRETSQEMQKRFWRNLEEAYNDPNDLFYRCIASYSEFTHVSAPQALRQFYLKLQQEAVDLKALWKYMILYHDVDKESKRESLSDLLLQLTRCIMSDKTLFLST